MSDTTGTDQPSAAALKACSRRRERGENTEAAARKRTSKASLQGMLQLPLLEDLEEARGSAALR